MTQQIPVMSISNMRLIAEANPINETIYKQEILGVAGLEGHGQSAFLESLAGFYTPISGTVHRLNGDVQTPITTPSESIRSRVVYMPSDRKKNGIFPNLSVQDNFNLGNLGLFSNWGWIKKQQPHQTLDGYQQELSMTYAHRDIPISSLSGGNQQKVLLARAMAMNPEIMVLNDPTRGVDIQTRRTLYDYFRANVAERGMTLVILSTELDEILELCDRVLVFRNYNIFAQLNKKNISMESMMAAMFGQVSSQSQTTQDKTVNGDIRIKQ